MAIEIKIPPIDFEPDVAVGIGLPMNNPSGADFNLTYTTLDQAISNATNLLLTNKGERVMQPTFGCDLDRQVFENITDTLLGTIEDTIRTQFQYWLSYIFINELELTPDYDNNRIYIQLTISLAGNQLDTRSIQLEVTATNV